MGLLDWFLQRTPRLEEGRPSQQLIDDTIDYVVKLTDARLTLVHHYRERLTGPVARSLEYLHGLRANLPPTYEVGPLSWSLEPALRVCFPRNIDFLDAFSQCSALRDYAAKSSVNDPIYAVLAMRLEEQRRFGTGLQGQMVVRDVAQTALSFSEHRIRLFAASERDMTRAIARRLLDELTLIALERMQTEQTERRELEDQRELLSNRLSALTRRGVGAESFLGTAGAQLSPGESQELLRELERNETELARLGAANEQLERQLDHLAMVLAEPMRFVQIERRTLHVDSMNVIVDATQGEMIEFGQVGVSRAPDQQHAFLPLRIERALIGDGRRLRLDNAERWL